MNMKGSQGKRPIEVINFCAQEIFGQLEMITSRWRTYNDVPDRLMEKNRILFYTQHNFFLLKVIQSIQRSCLLYYTYFVELTEYQTGMKYIEISMPYWNFKMKITLITYLIKPLCIYTINYQMIYWFERFYCWLTKRTN